jgi:hypothetical protein
MRQTASKRIVRPSALLAVTVIRFPGARPVAIPSMTKTSSPVRPSDSRLSPGAYWSGRMPMPTRLLRWMRSKLSAMTARTPRSRGPFAAQSRDEPEPYSLPASTRAGTPSCSYRIAAS